MSEVDRARMLSAATTLAMSGARKEFLGQKEKCRMSSVIRFCARSFTHAFIACLLILLEIRGQIGSAQGGPILPDDGCDSTRIILFTCFTTSQKKVLARLVKQFALAYVDCGEAGLNFRRRPFFDYSRFFLCSFNFTSMDKIGPTRNGFDSNSRTPSLMLCTPNLCRTLLVPSLSLSCFQRIVT